MIDQPKMGHFRLNYFAKLIIVHVQAEKKPTVSRPDENEWIINLMYFQGKYP